MATIAQTTKLLQATGKSVALGLYHTIYEYRMEVEKFINDIYRGMVCIKRKATTCSAWKVFLDQDVVELVYKFVEKSYPSKKRKILQTTCSRSLFSDLPCKIYI